jgi:hypothetical protein
MNYEEKVTMAKRIAYLWAEAYGPRWESANEEKDELFDVAISFGIRSEIYEMANLALQGKLS